MNSFALSLLIGQRGTFQSVIPLFCPNPHGFFQWLMLEFLLCFFRVRVFGGQGTIHCLVMQTFL